jgi:hypothetical protein
MLTRKNLSITLLAAMAGGSLYAANLTGFATGDVLICFRNPGSGKDMVVDAGPYTTFTGLSVNQRYTIAAYTGDQLNQINTNGTSWSAFTWLADNTLFITKPRATLDKQSTAWANKSSDNQFQTAARMSSIVVGATNNLYSGGFDSASVKIEEDNSVSNPNYPRGASYRDAIFGAGAFANFYATFQGIPENTTPSDFTDAGTVQRSDLYRLDPTGSGNATYLGYFELSTNGVLTYVAYPTATPVIKSFSRSGNSTTIVYTTGLYGNYTLCATNAAGLIAPRSTWPSIATLTAGDSSQHSVPDITTESNRFYFIKAQ